MEKGKYSKLSIVTKQKPSDIALREKTKKFTLLADNGGGQNPCPLGKFKFQGEIMPGKIK